MSVDLKACAKMAEKLIDMLGDAAHLTTGIDAAELPRPSAPGGLHERVRAAHALARRLTLLLEAVLPPGDGAGPGVRRGHGER